LSVDRSSTLSVNSTTAKEVFAVLWAEGGRPGEIVKARVVTASDHDLVAEPL
jgi:hypothetical protein